VRIVDNQMADAIRLASIQQGYEPREHVLYGYGGAGPLHATALARELGIRTVVVPLGDLASGWSAFGVVASDAVVVEEAARSETYPFDLEELNRVWDALEAKVAAAMHEQGIDRDALAWEREVDVRYTMQVHVVQVRAPLGRWDADAARALIEAFEREYERLFGPGSGYADAGYGMTALRVRARAQVTDFRLGEAAAGDAPRPRESRGVIFYDRGPDRRETPVYAGDRLGPGATLAGPAIVEFVDTTLVLHDGQVATIDRFGSIVVAL
jgi:N-methylhydantoinase A